MNVCLSVGAERRRAVSKCRVHSGAVSPVLSAGADTVVGRVHSGAVSPVLSAGADTVVGRCLRRGSAAASCWDCGFESSRGHACLF